MPFRPLLSHVLLIETEGQHSMNSMNKHVTCFTLM